MGRAFVLRLSPCLPLTREVANPKGLTEGEIRRAYAKRNAKRVLVANSLPQSPAATAPSSEGAKGVVEGRSHSRLWSPIQKEEGLREEHGSSRQIARGPRRGAARRFRRNARDQEGFRGAFRPW